MPNQRSSLDVPPASAPGPQGGAEAWSPLLSLRDEIDRLFDDFGAGFWRHPLTRRAGTHAGLARTMPLSPMIELVDLGTEYCVTAELPGLTPDQVDIRLSDGMLTIRGEKSEETRDEKADCLLSERHYGAFQRSLRLPVGVDADKITAQLAQGVLRVTLPKTPEARKTDRKIEIKVA
jgi:HSP20 family protein